MCGIAGLVNLRPGPPIRTRALARMAHSLVHRGPDEEGYFTTDAAGLACRRLAILGIADGQQPVYNETRSVVAVFNGELFDYPELRQSLASRGHVLRSHTDSELLVHLWEDYGEDMFPHIRGQFAFALLDLPRKRLILARDRVGICPLYWSRQGDTLVFGSEIKALLASGLVPREPDLQGLDNIWTFFCAPGRRTSFKGVESLLPGQYLSVVFDTDAAPSIAARIYWDLDFPDCGDEEPPDGTDALVSQFDSLLGDAVRRRLRADVPVAAYLSGGVDSSLVLAKVHEINGAGSSTFTARIGQASLDESSTAAMTARRFGCDHHTVDCDNAALLQRFPAVVTAADSPVVDPNAGSLHALSAAVHSAGFKAVLTGEGADEALAGYVWFKAHRAIRGLGWDGFRPLVSAAAALYRRRYPKAPRAEFPRVNDVLGGLHAQTLVYHLTSVPKWSLLREDLLHEIQAETAYDQLDFDAARIRRWHPLNQSLYFTYKTQLPGLLLNHRGDRVAMANSVEARYPFLDEDVIAFCARLHPRWKLKGLFGDKHILRLAARRHLPESLAARPKAMFRAPFAASLLNGSARYVAELISGESLKRASYFSPAAVDRVVHRLRRQSPLNPLRLFDEMSLCAVIGTQLWHHLFMGGGLCELPEWAAPSIHP
jgi:asparagine synthase (glutamine-hydrolysing)